MIVSRTPLRISLAGGGTDLPDFYRFHEWGAVTSTAISAYVTIIVAPKFDGRVRAAYAVQENVDEASKINHPIIRECLKWCEIKHGIEIMSHSDIPGNSGLGGSSSFTVGLLNALCAFQGKQVSRYKLAENAHSIERDHCGVPVGKQDHYIAAFGGTRHFIFSRKGDICGDEKKVMVKTPIGNTRSILNRHLLLFCVGVFRGADVILRDMRDHVDERAWTYKEMREQGVRMYRALKFFGIDKNPGDIIRDGWERKRRLSRQISSDHIDGLVHKAIGAGATGAKVGGAGGGGFLIVWAERDKHDSIRAALGLREWPVRAGAPGSQIVYAN